MNLTDSILVALFCMAVVFCILAVLWGLIRVFSFIIRSFESKSNSESSSM